MPKADALANVPPANIEQAYRHLLNAFRTANLPTPDIDAALLLEHACGATKLLRMTVPNTPINLQDWEVLKTYCARRLSHEPVHRILGAREFYGLTLELNDATLVPRPDTEILVDAVLPFVQKQSECKILDLGTGSGAIALALLSQAQMATATGVDIAENALEIAMQNARANQLDQRFSAVHSSWFDNVEGSFDLIVSNPPYIASKVIEGLDKDVREHDPMLALDGGNDGLDAYRILAQNSRKYMNKGARIAVEIGFDQKEAVSALFSAAGFQIISAHNDLNGQNRVLFWS